MLAAISVRHLYRLLREGNGPEALPNSLYPVEGVREWLKRRLLADVQVGSDGEVYNLDAERARLAKAQADKTELEVRELRGEMVRCDEVTETWSAMAGAMRSRMLSIPSKLAAKIADTARRVEFEDACRALVYEGLSELAADGLPERARARRDAHAGGTGAAAGADDQPVGGPLPAPVARGKRRAGRVPNEPG